jgi:predicted O-methyltransferase YrrM
VTVTVGAASAGQHDRRPHGVEERAGRRGAAAVVRDLQEIFAEDWEFTTGEALWGQDWFPRLDAAMAYAVVRRHRPSWIVEVGSGHSTRFIARAIEDGGLTTQIVAVDPAPRAALRGLRVEWLPQTVPACGLAPFQRLAAGDLLFIDSSHILMPGSDVDILLNRVLPALPAGALVHIHDIFLPFDYPAIWGWRAYNEQQGVVPLLATGAYKPLFSSAWVERRQSDRLAASVVPRLPRPADALAASLWLEKR